MSEYLGFEPTKCADYYFVSYNSEDVGRITPIVKKLSSNGVPLWYDHGLEYGEEWERQITERINGCQAVILFFTTGILKKEKSYVRREYEIASFFRKRVYVVIMDTILNEDVPLHFVPWYLEVMNHHSLKISDTTDTNVHVTQIESAIGFEPELLPSKSTPQLTTDFHTEKNSAITNIHNNSYSQGLLFKQQWNGSYAVIGLGSCQDKEIRIPPTTPEGYEVEKIGAEAFYYCKELVSVTIPDTVKVIGEDAFHGCANLTTLVIPNSVISIQKKAFASCEKLTSLTLPNRISKIEASTFNCCGLKTVTIPNSVKSIGNSAFACSKLTTITIPQGVTSIEDWAFFACKSLQSVIIPKSVTSIGEAAFTECDALTIYCAHSMKPLSWNFRWNSSHRPVKWKHKSSI